MAKFNLKYFGELDLSDLDSLKKNLYKREIYKDNSVRFWLDIKPEQVNEELLNTIQRILEDLESFDAKNLEYLNDIYDKPHGETVREYINSLLENYEEEVDEYINSDIHTPPAIQILHKLHLVGLGIDPFSEEHQLTFDYSLNKNITNDLLVLWLNIKTRHVEIGIES